MNKVVVKQSFGLTPNAKNAVAYCDDHYLAYISGGQVALINTETKDQNFIVIASPHHQFHTLALTAIACSYPKKYVAVGEKCDPVAVVSLFDTHSLRRKKVLNYPDLGSREVKSISFSDDGKYCVVQGGAPEWNLVLWNVEKNPKVLATFKSSSSDETPVHQVSFCPWDPTTILVIGKMIFKIIRFVDNQLRPYSSSIRRDTANILSYGWLSNDNLVLGTEAGEILLLENFEFRAVVHPTPATTGDLTPIHSLVATSRGFLAGTVDGEIKLFERNDELKEQFELDAQTKVTLPITRGNVIGMTIGSDDNLVCYTDTQQLFHMSVSNFYNKQEQKGGFEPVLTTFHGPNVRGEAAVVAIDSAIWKPVVASCGKDGTVRIWNPNDKKIELVKKYDEEPTTLSLHPSGLYMALGFTDKILIVSVLLDELLPSHNIAVRNCTYCKFSSGGHFLAAINGSTIQIFDTFTGLLVHTLRGHNNKIRSIKWLNVDASLMSVGAEGVVFYWNLFPQPSKKGEQFVGSVPFLSGISMNDSSRAFISTSEKQVKEIWFSRTIDAATGSEGSIREPRAVDIGYCSNCMVLDEKKRILLVATNDDDQPGCVLGFMTSPHLMTNFEITALHAGPITAMCLSHDGFYLYTGDVHGTICVSEFEASAEKAVGNAREGLSSFEFVDEVMIKKATLESKKALVIDLSSRVEELNENNEHQLRLKEMEHNQKVMDISDKFLVQLGQEKQKYETLSQDKVSMEHQYKNRIQTLSEGQNKEIKSIEVKYKAKITSESTRYKTLMADIEEMHERWNQENAALVESHQMYLKELTEDYEDKLHEEQELQRQILSEKDRLNNNYEANRDHIEEDGDIEIIEMKEKYQMRLKHEEETGIELMAEHAMIKKKLQSLTSQSDAQKEEIKRLRDKEARLLETIKSLDKDIQSHKKEIGERETTITDKEKRIFDLKKKNQELEKFRFVLDYKIKELKLQIAPREEEIATMRKQIEDMGLELEQYHKSNLALNLMIEELKLKLEGVRKEYSAQEERVDVNTRLMDKIKRDLQELAECKEDNGPLKAKMIMLYRVYVQEELTGGSASGGGGAGGGDVISPQEAYNRDREQMERSLDALRKAIKTDSRAHRRDYCKMMRENVVLTNELNLLRREARYLQGQERAIENAGVIGAGTDIAALLDVLGIELKKPKTPPKPRKSAPNKGGADATMSKPSSTGESKSEAADMLHPRARTTALRTVTSDGKAIMVDSTKADHYEAWREIQLQQQQIQQLEDNLNSLCHSLGINPIQVLSRVDAMVSASISKK